MKGNAGAMKYNDIKCNAGTMENVLSGILAAAVEPVYRPTLRLLVFVKQNITIIVYPNHFDHFNYRCLKKVNFAELSICRLEFKPVVGNPSLKLFFGHFLLRLSGIKRSQALSMQKFGHTASNFDYECI